jgi:hypothetical protein
VLGSMTQEVMTRHIEHRPKQEMRLPLERLGLDEQRDTPSNKLTEVWSSRSAERTLLISRSALRQEC